MPMSPENIGYNGQTVRPEIQTVLDSIDRQMSDPVYVSTGNRASPQDQKKGILQYEFNRPGMLNQVELSTIESGWKQEGWTEVRIWNETQIAYESAGYSQWHLVIRYVPPTASSGTSS